MISRIPCSAEADRVGRLDEPRPAEIYTSEASLGGGFRPVCRHTYGLQQPTVVHGSRDAHRMTTVVVKLQDVIRRVDGSTPITLSGGVVHPSSTAVANTKRLAE
jgi:hypothetical protein